MRRPFLIGLITLAIAATTSAQQRANPGASSAPAAVHPMHVAPPAAPLHVAPAHPSGPAASAHAPVNRVPVASNVKPVTPHPRRPVSAPPPTGPGTAPPPSGGSGPHGPHVAWNCNSGFRYPVQGYNGCYPSTGVGYGAAYFIPVPYYYGDASAQPEEQAQEAPAERVEAAPEENVDAQQTGTAEAAEQDDQRPVESRDYAQQATGSAAALNESLAQFVFVQRDGTKVYAVAYSFMSDRLHYVTKDGARHTVALDALDLDATQKLNEQLGNTINLPSAPSSGDALYIPPAPVR